MLFSGSHPVFLFAIVNMPQCYEGMRWWVSIAGWAWEAVISNRGLNKELIRVTHYWLHNGEKGTHWFKARCEDANHVAVLRGNACFPLTQPVLAPLDSKSVIELAGPLQLQVDELGTTGVSSTLESGSWIKVSTITYLLCGPTLVSHSCHSAHTLFCFTICE